MKTKIIKPTEKNILKAAEIIKKNGIVAFPTETVYGLGANALSKEAVKKIFKAKGRPFDDPLIVHVTSIEQMQEIAFTNEKAEKIAKKFWPGPLTMVLKKRKNVPNETTAGLDTVAVRMPSNKTAFALIEKSKTPIAAPSANLFSRPSPTKAEHVKNDLEGKVEIILDGGMTDFGLESTVIDVTKKTPVLLRPGAITIEMIEKTFGKIKIHSMVKKGKITSKEATASPGMKYKHYAPKAEVILVEGPKKKMREKIEQLLEGKRMIAVISSERKNNYNALVKFAGNDAKQFARNIFSLFRELDDKKVETIIVEGISEKGIGLAVMNRVRKAASKNIKVK